MKRNLKINHFIKNNSSTILTVVGSIGVGITAIMAARDTAKAIKRLEKEHWSYEEGKHYYHKDIPMMRKIKTAGPCYIPTILSGVSTILCICGANKINRNIQKSLTSAYILLDQSLQEYKHSVKETCGEDGEIKAIGNLIDKKLEEPDKTEPDDVIFDFYSLQFFYSDIGIMPDIEKTINDIFQTKGYISLKEVHTLLGEETHGTDSLLGWSIGAGEVYGYNKIELDIRELKREDGSKYFVLDFMSPPSDDYMYYV